MLSRLKWSSLISFLPDGGGAECFAIFGWGNFRGGAMFMGGQLRIWGAKVNMGGGN